MKLFKQRIWINVRFTLFLLFFYLGVNFLLYKLLAKDGLQNFFHLGMAHPEYFFIICWIFVIFNALFIYLLRKILKYLYALRQ
jgi:hypothetical protein